jgi:hypothetical protein
MDENPAIMLEDGTVVTFQDFYEMSEEDKCAFEDRVRSEDTYSIPDEPC